MDDIGLLTNEREINIMHDDYQKTLQKEKSTASHIEVNDPLPVNTTQSTNFFENSQISSSFNTFIGNNQMQHQQNDSNASKRKLYELTAQENKKQRQ